jgi:acetyl-CoA acyltransferase 2
MRDVYLIDGVRTPMGRFGGALRDVNAPTLAEVVMRETLQRCQVDAAEMDEIIFGQVFQGSDAPDLARFCALRVGLPPDVPGITLNRQCASGLEAVALAAKNIILGEADLVLSGGVESMSTVPYVLRGMRWGVKMGPHFVHDGMFELRDDVSAGGMWMWAEHMAERFNVTRPQLDEYALLSHQRAVAATRSGRFAEEIVPVDLPPRKGQPARLEVDEGPRAETSLEKLAALKPAFKRGGTVTAGNASQISDGASALLVASAEKAQALGLEPQARVMAWAVVGVDPMLTGWANVPAIRQVLEKAGLSLADIGLFEVNEAFAVVNCVVERELGLDRERVNVNGGAIALGHPVGMSGNRLLLTMVKEMRRRGVEHGLVSLCAGGGMGMAMVVGIEA